MDKKRFLISLFVAFLPIMAITQENWNKVFVFPSPNYVRFPAWVNLNEMRTWLANKGDLVSRFAIVDSWLQERHGDTAQMALTAIPNDLTLTDEEQTEYDHFSTLKGIQIGALEADLNDAQMVAANQEYFEELAEAGEFYASGQAKIYLNEYGGGNYQQRTTLPQTRGQQGILIPLNPTVPPYQKWDETAIYIKAIPNPARKVTSIYYCLPENVNTGRITVATMDGRIVREFGLSENSGKVSLASDLLPIGVYQYNLLTGDRILKSEKLVVTD